ncbi:hypothetical protein SADO_11034 [Salinisphaera dokdonensis CL-ES53]|uniref:Class I SAM-dependent methyltransferase n=1 Tax=Salinisphaera dokdonensis CL-ES53 TaxID=1304272 RepID=A0ABV2B2N0_9GAMM
MTEPQPYVQSFYDDRHRQTLYSAERVLECLDPILPDIKSAVDIGCGVGTWLSVLEARGVTKVQGYEGPWVDESLLQIPVECFEKRDLTQLIPAPTERFDLALSLEVAEHLPPESASTFVESLTNQADFIVFSAAIPHQGGRHHVNEQWLEYWLQLFEAHDYIGLDVVRRTLWDDERIQRWYRQNVILVAKRSRVDSLTLPNSPDALRPLSLVHPRSLEDRIAAYERARTKAQSLSGSWKLFRRAVRRSLKGA